MLAPFALLAARQIVARQLVQVTRRLAARPDCPRHQFYDTLTYKNRPPDYWEYIRMLKQEENLTMAELRQIIVSQFTCGYNFNCRYNITFQSSSDPAPDEDKAAAARRDAIIESYFRAHSYENCLRGIAADPKLLDYELINKIHVKALFWLGKFQKCRRVINAQNRPEAHSDPGDRIFYYLQRAQCAQHLGELTKARADCTAAAATAPRVKCQERLPAILWLRAQLNYELGFKDRALSDLNALERVIQAVDWAFGPPLPRRGKEYFEKYKEIIAKEI